MRCSTIGALLLATAVASIPSSALADDGRRYTVLALTYEAAAARYHADAPSARDARDASASSLDHLVPRLELMTFGIDWFLKLESGDLGWLSGQARYSPGYIAAGEIGVHWATIPFGILAVGLKAGGARIGISDSAGAWIAGGTGFDAGVVVHYAFPVFGIAHVDPSISAGGSYLAGPNDGYAGAWSRARLELLVRVLDSVSVLAAAGLDLRTYASRSADPTTRSSFDGRIFTVGAGLALQL